MIDKLYNYRFEIFFLGLLSILFGAIFFPFGLFEIVLKPVIYLLNIASGILLISKNKKLMWFLTVILATVILIYILLFFVKTEIENYEFVRLGSYFLFYIIVTYELIKQVWLAKIISKNVIIGLMSGYICLGLVSFFIFLTIEMVSPGSFNGIDLSINALLYFSYITLLSIGYGDITPITLVAQKATILTGLMGQFYMVILTATIIGKYIAQIAQEKNK